MFHFYTPWKCQKIRSYMYVSCMWAVAAGTVRAEKIIQEKSAIATKILNYAKSLCTIFYAKIFRYSHYTYWLHKELTHCRVMVSTHHVLEVSAHFWVHKITRKPSNIHKHFGQYQVFIHNFLSQTAEIPIFHIICMLPKLLTTWITQFCFITLPNLFLDLAYTNRTNSILHFNINYKKVLKFVGTSNLLCMNSNYSKKLKTT